MNFSMTRRTGLALGLAFAASLLPSLSQADALDDITAAGVIKVGIFQDFPPFASLNTSMKVEGYDTEVADKLAAALGVKESRRVLELIKDVRNRGIPIILISHNMPHVFEVADRIHIHRLGRRLCVIKPQDYTMSDAVAFMTGAKLPEGVTDHAGALA